MIGAATRSSDILPTRRFVDQEMMTVRIEQGCAEPWRLRINSGECLRWGKQAVRFGGGDGYSGQRLRAGPLQSQLVDA